MREQVGELLEAEEEQRRVLESVARLRTAAEVPRLPRVDRADVRHLVRLARVRDRVDDLRCAGRDDDIHLVGEYEVSCHLRGARRSGLAVLHDDLDVPLLAAGRNALGQRLPDLADNVVVRGCEAGERTSLRADVSDLQSAARARTGSLEPAAARGERARRGGTGRADSGGPEQISTRYLARLFEVGHPSLHGGCDGS